jgi:transposase-like protein
MANTMNGVVSSEVSAAKPRRQFSAAEKQRILREMDESNTPHGEILRREGIYSSHVSRWRAERAEAERQALEPRRRGRKSNPLQQELDRSQREVERLKRELKQAQAVIALQKKVSEILGVVLPDNENG